MLYGNQSINTYTPANICIWMALALQAGVLNVGGFLACHSFVSHVTGFATLFGVKLDAGDYQAAWVMLLVPGFFLLGAMMSGFLVDLQLKLHRKPRYYIVFGVIFTELLLVVVGGYNHIFGEFGAPVLRLWDYVLLALLCLICGTQNALITVVSKSVVRTTHLTGITTDLGIGIVRVLNRGRLSGHVEEEGKANLMRIGIIGFFTMGSVLGVKLFTLLAYRGFIFPAAISGTLFFLTLYFQLIHHRPRI